MRACVQSSFLSFATSPVRKMLSPVTGIVGLGSVGPPASVGVRVRVSFMRCVATGYENSSCLRACVRVYTTEQFSVVRGAVCVHAGRRSSSTSPVAVRRSTPALRRRPSRLHSVADGAGACHGSCRYTLVLLFSVNLRTG